MEELGIVDISTKVNDGGGFPRGIAGDPVELCKRKLSDANTEFT